MPACLGFDSGWSATRSHAPGRHCRHLHIVNL